MHKVNPHATYLKPIAVDLLQCLTQNSHLDTTADPSADTTAAGKSNADCESLDVYTNIVLTVFFFPFLVFAHTDTTDVGTGTATDAAGGATDVPITDGPTDIPTDIPTDSASVPVATDISASVPISTSIPMASTVLPATVVTTASVAPTSSSLSSVSSKPTATVSHSAANYNTVNYVTILIAVAVIAIVS